MTKIKKANLIFTPPIIIYYLRAGPIKWAGRTFKQIFKKWAGPTKDKLAGKFAKKIGLCMLI